MKPHGLFEVWTPDTVAECLNGVKDDLYSALWALVPYYTKRDPEAECPPDPDFNALALFWDKLSPEHQAILNELAVEEEKSYGRV